MYTPVIAGATAPAEQPASLTGRIAVVTGAGRGIGASIAGELAACGATVVVNFIDHPDTADATVNRITRAGGTAEVMCADVTDRAQLRTTIGDVIAKHGQIDILVNNAGILRDRSFKNMSGEEWDAVIETDLTGVFNVSREVVPYMIAARQGCIVNISSVIGLTGNFGQANYSAAKAGVIALTRTLALELARYGIRANAICPGFVDTEMWKSIPANIQEEILDRIPLGRVASTIDIARGVRYLVSDAPYVTGETLNINGGFSMR
jgi:NAD(P)-dependent dehydrogenase (short-subunit alcohol dehydrogenase family)